VKRAWATSLPVCCWAMACSFCLFSRCRYSGTLLQADGSAEDGARNGGNEEGEHLSEEEGERRACRATGAVRSPVSCAECTGSQQLHKLRASRLPVLAVACVLQQCLLPGIVNPSCSKADMIEFLSSLLV